MDDKIKGDSYRDKVCRTVINIINISKTWLVLTHTININLILKKRKST